MEGYKTLKCFQRVTYDVEHGKNGRHAVNIIPGEAPKPQKSSDIPKEHISKTDI
jgi:CspA family cold shock protein